LQWPLQFAHDEAELESPIQLWWPLRWPLKFDHEQAKSKSLQFDRDNLFISAVTTSSVWPRWTWVGESSIWPQRLIQLGQDNPKSKSLPFDRDGLFNLAMTRSNQRVFNSVSMTSRNQPGQRPVGESTFSNSALTPSGGEGLLQVNYDGPKSESRSSSNG